MFLPDAVFWGQLRKPRNIFIISQPEGICKFKYE